MKSQQLNPERPKLILRVGVTGHRPDKLDDMNSEILNQRLTEIFGQLKSIVQRVRDKAPQTFSEHSPLLYLISPLADGADQIVADKAIEEGFELQCPIPFFTQDGKNQNYGKHLQDAVVLEMDGSVENREEAYESAGRMVLRHSDVLIAIWDKNNARGVGGTGQIVNEARKLWIPTIWISPIKPHETLLLVPHKDGSWKELDVSWLNEMLFAKLIPPESDHHDSNHHEEKSDLRNEYLQETILPFGSTFLGKFFRELLHGRILLPRGTRTEDAWNAQVQEWTEFSLETRTAIKEVIDRIENKIRAHYEYADELANRYSSLYYRGFKWNYVMSGFAVMFAFLIFAFEKSGKEVVANIFGTAELFALLSIMLVYLFDKKGKWYDRRIDYRLLAEMIRQTRFLATLGRIPPISAPQTIHTHYGDPSGSWVHWHYLAVVKQIGMPHTKLTPEYLRAVARLIKSETDEQAEYHDRKSIQNSKIDHHLHIYAVWLFLIAFLSCIAHFGFKYLEMIPYLGHALHDNEEFIKTVLSFLTIVGPAFGAACAGIRSQGEYERVARHSAAMADYLKEKSDQLDKLQHTTHLNSGSLAKVIDDIAEKRIEEVLDWRIVFHKRPIELA